MYTGMWTPPKSISLASRNRKANGQVCPWKCLACNLENCVGFHIRFSLSLAEFASYPLEIHCFTSAEARSSRLQGGPHWPAWPPENQPWEAAGYITPQWGLHCSCTRGDTWDQPTVSGQNIDAKGWEQDGSQKLRWMAPFDMQTSHMLLRIHFPIHSRRAKSSLRKCAPGTSPEGCPRSCTSILNGQVESRQDPSQTQKETCQTPIHSQLVNIWSEVSKLLQQMFCGASELAILSWQFL